jgi:hypothetical protein
MLVVGHVEVCNPLLLSHGLGAGAPTQVGVSLRQTHLRPSGDWRRGWRTGHVGWRIGRWS